jgi:hypothetical protein
MSVLAVCLFVCLFVCACAIRIVERLLNRVPLCLEYYCLTNELHGTGLNGRQDC